MTRADSPPSLLVTTGLVELAAGAVSGWVYTLATTDPERAKRLGILSAARIRQWHLDLAMLGTGTVAVGVAVPDAPRVTQLALGAGAWSNAMMFLPLAFAPEAIDSKVYRATAAASFVATTVGFVGMAATAVRRRRVAH